MYRERERDGDENMKQKLLLERNNGRGSGGIRRNSESKSNEAQQ